MLKFTIAETSDLVFEGMAAVIRKISSDYRISRVSEAHRLVEQVADEHPDVLIVDVAFIGMETPDRLRASLNRSEMVLVGLVTELRDMPHAQDFDEYISLFDDYRRIEEKILRLDTRQTEVGEEEKTLSQREKEIVSYVVKGFTNTQIAEKLFLSRHTVITHRRNIAAKIQVHSSAGLTVYAIMNKLVKLEEIKGIVKDRQR